MPVRRFFWMNFVNNAFCMLIPCNLLSYTMLQGFCWNVLTQKYLRPSRERKRAVESRAGNRSLTFAAPNRRTSASHTLSDQVRPQPGGLLQRGPLPKLPDLLVVAVQ